MKARTLGAVLVLALCAALAWRCVGRKADPRITSPPLAPATGAREAGPEAPRELSSPGSGRSSAPASDPSPASVPCTVIEAETGAGVSGAEVFAFEWPESSPEEARLATAERGQLHDFLALHGERAMTDAMGQTRLPPAKARAHVFARHGSSWALS